MARVLIVEDEATDLAILRGIVKGAGHEFYSASDGERAYTTYLRTHIDVLITDLHMPRVGGIELITAIRALFPEAPIIAVSGKGPELLAEAKKEGAFVTLSKPVDPEDLLKAIAQAAHARTDGAGGTMLAAKDSSLMSQKTSVSPGSRPSPLGKYPVPYDGTIRLVGHRAREVQPGIVEVKAQVSCQGRTFDGEMSGPAAPPERLKVPAMATIRALDSLIRTLYRGVSYPTLVLDDVVEWSLDNSPVAVVMVTATEKTTSTPFVAACPLVGMSDLAIILAILQATSRTVSRWLAQGDTLPPSGEPERPK